MPATAPAASAPVTTTAATGLPRLEIFRPGTHTAMGGQSITFGEADLAATAAAYDPSVHEAPLVVGHPATDHPAWGWVQSLAVEGDRLVADAHQVDPAFAEAVGAGRYKKMSAAFYPPDSPANPTPGRYYLRHVGFLGAQPPAVKGLRSAAFGDDDDAHGVMTVTLDYAEGVSPQPQIDEAQAAPEAAPPEATVPEAAPPPPTLLVDLERRTAELEAEKAKLEAEKASFAARRAADEAAVLIDRHIAAGRVLPSQRDRLVAFAAHLHGQPDDSLSFADDLSGGAVGGGAVGQPSPRQVFEDFLATLPKTVEFGELAPSTSTQAGVPEGAEDIARAAIAFQEAQTAMGQPISIDRAVRHVMKKDKAQ